VRLAQGVHLLLRSGEPTVPVHDCSSSVVVGALVVFLWHMTGEQQRMGGSVPMHVDGSSGSDVHYMHPGVPDARFAGCPACPGSLLRGTVGVPGGLHRPPIMVRVLLIGPHLPSLASLDRFGIGLKPTPILGGLDIWSTPTRLRIWPSDTSPSYGFLLRYGLRAAKPCNGCTCGDRAGDVGPPCTADVPALSSVPFLDGFLTNSDLLFLPH